MKEIMATTIHLILEGYVPVAHSDTNMCLIKIDCPWVFIVPSVYFLSSSRNKAIVGPSWEDWLSLHRR